jgi:hypothetical protein
MRNVWDNLTSICRMQIIARQREEALAYARVIISELLGWLPMSRDCAAKFTAANRRTDTPLLCYSHPRLALPHGVRGRLS